MIRYSTIPITFISLLLINIPVFSQSLIEEKLRKVKVFPVELVHLHDSTFIEKHESMMWHYKLFQYELYLNKDSSNLSFSKLYNLNTPFFETEGYLMGIDEIMMPRYSKGSWPVMYDLSFLHSFPIHNITYGQVNLFCLWKSKFITELINQELIKNDRAFRVKANYRLPKKDEWMRAYDDSIKYQNLDIFNKKSTDFFESKLNVSRSKKVEKHTVFYFHDYRNLKDYQKRMKYIHNSFKEAPQNKRGIYFMKGNMSEMVNKEGVSMGTSWKNGNNEVLENRYECPNDSTGFRLVCDIEILSDTSEIIFPDLSFDLNSLCVEVEDRNFRLANKGAYYNELKMKERMKIQYPTCFNTFLNINDNKTDTTIITNKDSLSINLENIYDSIKVWLTSYGGRNAIRIYKEYKFELTSYFAIPQLKYFYVYGIFIRAVKDEEEYFFFRVIKNGKI